MNPLRNPGKLATGCLLAGAALVSPYRALADGEPEVRPLVAESQGVSRAEIQSADGSAIWRALQKDLWSIATEAVDCS